MKLLEKKRIASNIIKRYDIPKTPYQRVLESSDIPGSIKRSLKQQFNQMNPFSLKKAIEKKLSKIFELINYYQIDSDIASVTFFKESTGFLKKDVPGFGIVPLSLRKILDIHPSQCHGERSCGEREPE